MRELPRWVLLQLAAFSILAVRLWRGRVCLPRAFTLCALVFGAWILAASIFAASPWRSIFGPYEGHTGVLALWTCIALAASIAGIEALPRATAILAGLGFVETLTMAIGRARDGPPIGTFGHVLFFAEFMTLAILAAAGWAADVERPRPRLALVFGASAMIAALTVAGRRTSLVALLLGLAFLAFAAGAERRRRLVPLAIGGAIAVIAFSGFVPNPLQPYQPLARWADVVHPNDAALGGDRIRQRMDYYRAALDAAAERPVAGYGFGAFRDLYAEKKSPRMPEETSVHSIWLDVLLSSGGVGLLSFAALIAAWIAAARVRLRRERDAPWFGRLCACAAIGIAHLAFLSFNFEQAALGGWAWAMAGFLLVERSEPRAGRAPIRRTAAVVLAAVGVFGAQRIVADLAFADCLSLTILGRYGEVEKECDRAVNVSPYECTYRLQLGRLISRSAPARAESLLGPCLELEPRNRAVRAELEAMKSR